MKKRRFWNSLFGSVIPKLWSTSEKISIFATNRKIKKISAPFQSRFFIAKVEQYTNGQFREIQNYYFQLISYKEKLPILYLMLCGINLGVSKIV